MKSAPAYVFYVALGAVLIVTAAWSQTNNDEKANEQWRRVQSLVPGAQVEVTRFKEKIVNRAVLLCATAFGLHLASGIVWYLAYLLKPGENHW